MKKFNFILLLGLLGINPLIAQIPSGGGGRGGGGINVTGTYVFNSQQFTAVNATNISWASGGKATNIDLYGTATGQAVTLSGNLTLNGATASRPLLTDASKIAVSGLIDLTSATHVAFPHSNNGFTTNAFSNNRIVSAVTAQAFTNAILNSVAGETVFVPPGTYVIPAMTNMARDRVNYYFDAGAKIIVMGGTSPMDDVGGASITNRIAGHGEFVMSNGISFLSISSSNTEFFVSCKSIWGAKTNAGNILISRGAGKLDITASDFLREEGGKLFDDYGDAVFDGGHCFITADKFYAAETLLSQNEWYNSSGRGIYSAHLIERITNRPWATDLFFSMDGNAIVRADVINLQTNASIYATSGGGTLYSIFDVKTITCDPNSRVPLIRGQAIFKNTTFIGPTGFDPLYILGDVYLDNCSITAGASATNSIRGNGAATVHVRGGLDVNKPTSANITLDTGRINSFASPIAGQVVAFHDANTLTNITSSAVGGSATNANGVAGNVQLKHPDGSFLGAAGVNISTNTGQSNIMVSGTANMFNGTVSNILTFDVAGTDPQLRATTSTLILSNADFTALGSMSLAGDAQFKGSLYVSNLVMHGGPISYQTATISGTDIDWNIQSARYKQLTANTTFTFSNPADDQHIWIELQQDATGTRTATWPTATWLGHTNQSGTLTAGGVNTNANFITVFHFWRRSGTIYAEVGATPSRFEVDFLGSSVTSSDFLTHISDETGSGVMVAANGPSLGSFGSSTNANLNFSYTTNNNAFILTTQNIGTNSAVLSNITMNVNISVQDIYITNNVTITNFSNLEAGTSKTVTWHIYPTLVNRTVTWPTLGAAGHAIRSYTNANSPMWTTLTNGNMYVLSAEWRNTNVWLSISEWK